MKKVALKELRIPAEWKKKRQGDASLNRAYKLQHLRIFASLVPFWTLKPKIQSECQDERRNCFTADSLFEAALMDILAELPD